MGYGVAVAKRNHEVMHSNILVTGAVGFLGSHICQYFGQRGHSIIGVDKFSPTLLSSDFYPNLHGFYEIQLPDDTFISLLKDFQPALLIHCAGSASVPYSMQEPYDDFRQSAGVSAFILDSLRRYLPACHFIFLSSAAVYGNPVTLPITEETPCQPISPYGYHKYICEMLCQEFTSIYDIKCSILRIFSAYGERLRKQVIFDLCRKFADPSSQIVEVYGSGNETRDFIHAIDIAQAIEILFMKKATGIYNVAAGKQTHISEIVDMVKSCFHSGKDILYSGTLRTGDPLYWQADTSKLMGLGFQSTISIHEGIKNYYNWFRSEYGRKHDQ